MAEKRKRRLRKAGLIIITIVLLGISGCKANIPIEKSVTEDKSETQSFSQIEQNKAEQMIALCKDLYIRADKDGKKNDLETIRNIIDRLGERGYTAIDSKNQINMTCMDQVMQFCKKVEDKEEGTLTMIEVSYLGGIVIYDLQTKEGIVEVERNYYEYKAGDMQKTVSSSYTADSWRYTEEGYLMFSGIWFSKEQYLLTLSGEEEHIGFRVQPLDETYRELNRKYIQPIGYERNNMFLLDWSEDDFGELNFYDMYDIFYPKINTGDVPYLADDNLGVGAVYRIEKNEFENIIMTFFKIESEVLQTKTIYHPEDATYQYKPRGFYEVEYPEYPYPEVVGYTNNEDGTISLTVNVVFPYVGESKVYAHEVVVRPLENDGVQYVSNRIIPSEDNQIETWHTKRLTEEEWKEKYGDQ